NIDRNTVEKAYRKLVDQGWVASRRGSAFRVLSQEPLEEILRRSGRAIDEEDLIDLAIREARQKGYTPAELCRRVSVQPNRILVVSSDPGMAELLKFELEQQKVPRSDVQACSPNDLAGRRVDATLVVCLLGAAPDVRRLVGK